MDFMMTSPQVETSQDGGVALDGISLTGSEQPPYQGKYGCAVLHLGDTWRYE
jgi:hypothetical protein